MPASPKASVPEMPPTAVAELFLWGGVVVGLWESFGLAQARDGDLAWGGVLLATAAFGIAMVGAQGLVTYLLLGVVARLPGLGWLGGRAFRAGFATLGGMVLLPLLVAYNRTHPGFALDVYYVAPYAGLLVGSGVLALLGGLACQRLAGLPGVVRGTRLGVRSVGGVALVVGAVHWGIGAGNGREAGRAAPASDGGGRPNVVLISIDTIRADHLQSYGYEKPTDPDIQRFFRDGLRFESAYAPVPQTRPSHASMLAGLHPAELGMRWNEQEFPESVPTLPELLRDHGYHTAAFVAAAPLFGEPSGLDRGFDVYSDVFTPVLAIDDALANTTLMRLGVRLRLVDVVQRRADSVTDDVLGWLSRDPPEPFFLWVHYYDPHGRYEPPEEEARAMGVRPDQPLTDRGLTSKGQSGKLSFSPEERALGEALYDGEILFTDRQIGRLLEALEREGLLDGAVVMLVGDHGETLWERVEHENFFLNHGRSVDPWDLQIPFFVRGPGVEAGVVRGVTARTRDVAPTLLAFLGIPVPDGASGRNLLDGRPGEGEPIALCFNAPSSENLPSRLCAKKGEYWYVLEPETGVESLYRLPVAASPERRENVASHHPELVAELRQEVLEMAGIERDTESLDPLTAERLRSLGYLE